MSEIQARRLPWLNRTVVGIALASLFSDWSHEIATTLLPAFLATMGVAAAWLGVIEGVSDGLSSFAKMASGYYTDRLRRRKPIAVIGYVATALGTAAFGLASNAWHVLFARAGAWLGRGVRTPVRKALLAGAVSRDSYGRAFGFERLMDTCGAIVGPITAVALLRLLTGKYTTLFALTLIPGLLAAALMAFVVKEKARVPVPHISFGASLRALPASFRRLLVAVGLFGPGDFAHTLLILLAFIVDTNSGRSGSGGDCWPDSYGCTTWSTPDARSWPDGSRIDSISGVCSPAATFWPRSWHWRSSCYR
jgi:hypothetical protein